ncbi:MAG: hypothetical protein RL199_1995, partial [Pseudomonadota bacterium]
EARDWVEGFVGWYNDEHLHSAIRYVTPAARHAGLDKAILANRHEVYVAAHARKPIRWSRNTRNWKHIGVVRLNPVKHEVKTLPIALSVKLVGHRTTTLTLTAGVASDQTQAPSRPASVRPNQGPVSRSRPALRSSAKAASFSSAPWTDRRST